MDKEILRKEIKIEFKNLERLVGESKNYLEILKKSRIS